MILCVLGLLSLRPAPADRDPVADGAIRRAVVRMAQLTSWSASITVDRTNSTRDGSAYMIDTTVLHAAPPMLRRSGILRARAPYTFRVNLCGLSDRELPIARRWPIFTGDAILADRWSNVASESDQLRVTFLGGRQYEYKLSPECLITFVGNLAPLMLWLDRDKLPSFLGKGFRVVSDGGAVVDEVSCRIVKVEWTEEKNPPRAWMRLFIDERGLIRRSEYSWHDQVYVVTLSNIRVGEREGPSATPARVVMEEDVYNPIWATLQFDLLAWTTPLTK